MLDKAHGDLGDVLSCEGDSSHLTCPRWVSVTLMQPDPPGGSHYDLAIIRKTKNGEHDAILRP